MLDVVGAVMVRAEEVVTSFDKGNFFRGELWKSILKLLANWSWILSKVYRITKPPKKELLLSLAGYDVLCIFKIPRLDPVTFFRLVGLPDSPRQDWQLTVERDGNLATIFRPVLLSKQFHCGSMGHEDIMTSNPRLPRRITYRTLGPIARPPRCELSIVISVDTDAPRLIERNPELYTFSHCLEHYLCIVCEVFNKLLLVQQTTISFFQVIGEIPMIQSDKGFNASSFEILRKLDIMLKAFFVHRIISTTKWNNSRPRKWEAVRPSCQRLQQSNILCGLMVRVTSYFTRTTTSNLARYTAKRVPYRISSTVILRSAFDLIPTFASQFTLFTFR
jgi:hypothetical protein